MQEFNVVTDIRKKVHHKLSKTLFVTFQIGDRVIQTKNQADMNRYIETSQNGVTMYEKSEETGVLNGDMGKVKTILTADMMELHTEDSDLLKLCSKRNRIFVVVEYSFNGDSYLVIYSTSTSNLDGEPTYNGYETVGGDLAQISLGYAITVHKMQGSQAKHIILLWYNIQRDDFLSRNMLYTAITRAETGVTIYGDMHRIELARRVISNDKRNTYQKLYFKYLPEIP